MTTTSVRERPSRHREMAIAHVLAQVSAAMRGGVPPDRVVPVVERLLAQIRDGQLIRRIEP